MSKSYKLATVPQTCRQGHFKQSYSFLLEPSSFTFLTFPRPWFQRPAVVFSLACSWLPSSLHAVRLALLAHALTTFPILCLLLSSLSCRLAGSLSRSSRRYACCSLPSRALLLLSFQRRYVEHVQQKQYSSITCFFRRTCPLCSPGRQTNGHMDKRTHGQTVRRMSTKQTNVGLTHARPQIYMTDTQNQSSWSTYTACQTSSQLTSCSDT